MVYPVNEAADGLLPALKRICDEACSAAEKGYSLVILSDRKAGRDYIPVRYSTNHLFNFGLVSYLFHLKF